MNLLQLTGGVVIAVFAALVCFEANKLSFGTSRSPGPGFLPLAGGVILFLLSLLFVLQTALKREGPSSAEGSPWSGVQWQQVPATLAFLLVFALLLQRLGYLICTWLLMTFLFWDRAAKRKHYAAIMALAVTVVTYMIFKGLLKIRLPAGVLGF